MSSTLSPITILEHTSHIHNKQHWQHVQYIQSNHYIRTYVPHTLHNKQHWQHDQYTQSNHCIRTYVPHTLQTTLTTCPVHSVQSLYYKICPTYETHSTDHMSSTYSPITILDPTIHLRNTHHWPHVGQCCVFRKWVVGSNIVIGLYVLDMWSVLCFVSGWWDLI